MALDKCIQVLRRRMAMGRARGSVAFERVHLKRKLYRRWCGLAPSLAPSLALEDDAASMKNTIFLESETYMRGVRVPPTVSVNF